MAIRNWGNDKLGQLQTGANTKIGAVTNCERLVDSEQKP